MQTTMQEANKPKESDAFLAQALMAISQKIDQFSQSSSDKSKSGQAIATQLEKIVESMSVMNRELEEVSEASQQKAKWLTKLGRNKAK